MNQAYLDRFPCTLGHLIGNLWSLEWMLRNVLYRLRYPPHTAMSSRPLFAANVGDRFPTNALTSYDSLGLLIDAYNQSASVPIDRSLVDLRDTLAHGRVLYGDDTWVNLSLMKFSKPSAEGSVTVTIRYDLTVDWMDKQVARTRQTLDSVIARYRELGGI